MKSNCSFTVLLIAAVVVCQFTLPPQPVEADEALTEVAVPRLHPGEPATRFDYLEDIEPIFDDFCWRCHGVDKDLGDLNIEARLTEQPLVRNTDVWVNVLARLRNSEMPPKDELQLSDEDRQKLVDWLEEKINKFDYSTVDNPGYETIRRLTQIEYNNTMRDLFGVDLHLNENMPPDMMGTSGFENSANTLFLQSTLMEKYFYAADLTVETTLPQRQTTPEHKRSRLLIFGPRSAAAGSPEQRGEKILQRFMRRAFRREVTDAELAAAVSQFKAAYDGDQNFDSAIKVTLKSILISPHFLLRIESSQNTAEAYAVNDYELASRLSYFLWSSMPDEVLLDLAKQDKLHDDRVLRQQVNRMLVDDKAQTLGTVFAAQWLGFNILGTRIRPDPIDNPFCTDTLMAAMRTETAMFYNSLIRENQPMSRFVDANYTFLNEELARHYKIDGIKGDKMRRVMVTDPNRGGIFGQASVLMVTAFGRRTSPVLRGKWVLSDVLGTPPPDPPPDAGDIPREIRRNRKLTARQKLEMHRADPSCASCHDEMDPLGFSLENFDGFGRWRTRVGRTPIDASGTMPDGTQFNGPAGLKKVIVAQRMDDLTRQITRKTLAYALGRQLEWDDEPAVREIIAGIEQDKRRFKALIYEVVESYPFRYKKNPPVTEAQALGS